MLIFHAIGDADIVPIFYDKTGIRLNIMVAYNNIKRNASKLTDRYRNQINLLYLDSGAYSAHTGRSNVDVHDYRAYLRCYGHKFDACFNLDDCFDSPAHNLRNQLCLEEGLPSNRRAPIPVIHDKQDPLGEFETYVGLNHDYIALGSSSSARTKEELLQKAKEKYPAVRIHLFGDLSWKLLERHRPYSADSSTWAHRAGRYGGIYYWRSCV